MLTLASYAPCRFTEQEFTESSPGYFDSHSFFTDILTNPSAYLNGTAPLNTTAPVYSCIYSDADPKKSTCTKVQGNDRDSYVWYVFSVRGAKFCS